MSDLGSKSHMHRMWVEVRQTPTPFASAGLLSRQLRRGEGLSFSSSKAFISKVVGEACPAAPPHPHSSRPHPVGTAASRAMVLTQVLAASLSSKFLSAAGLAQVGKVARLLSLGEYPGGSWGHRGLSLDPWKGRAASC